MRATGVPKRPVRVLVVDDHPIVRKGLIDLIREEPGLEVSGEAGSQAEAIAKVVDTRPDVAIVDLSLGLESGLDLVGTLRDLHPTVHVLVLSGHDERLYADRALAAGALGYIMKDRAASDLLTAIRRVAMARPYVSEETADRILSAAGTRASARVPSPIARLSDRERHVMALVGRGRSTREIATQLGLSVKTVESHLAHIKEKLGLSSGRELTRLAVSLTEQRTL